MSGVYDEADVPVDDAGFLAGMRDKYPGSCFHVYDGWICLRDRGHHDGIHEPGGADDKGDLAALGTLVRLHFNPSGSSIRADDPGMVWVRFEKEDYDRLAEALYPYPGEATR